MCVTNQIVNVLTLNYCHREVSILTTQYHTNNLVEGTNSILVVNLLNVIVKIYTINFRD